MINVKYIVVILILGISFRVAHLGDKIFWVDEVATITRVSGYTRSQILAEVQQQDIIYASDLLKYQQLSPEKTFSDTINALVQSPEHAPLYYILTRFWLQLFGNSIVVLRSLSIIFGLLCLPSIFLLAQELFNSKTASRIALSFLSISPFYVAYSQEARHYSLWTLLILNTSILLLKSLKYKKDIYWCSYLLVTILNLYTSLFSWLILFAQGCYLILLKDMGNIKRFLLVNLICLITFIPWLWVILNHWYQLQDNTSWMNEPMKLGEMIAVWVGSILLIFGNLPLSPELNIIIVVGILILLIFLLSIILAIYYLTRKSFVINSKLLFILAAINFTVLFILIKISDRNLPIKSILDPVPIIGITTAFGLLFLVLYSGIFTSKKAPNKIKYFILSLFSIPTVTLILSDFILQDQRSATPRYLIPAQLAIILTVTYLLSQKKSAIAQITFNGLLILSIVSCSLTWQNSPQFQKSRNYHNPAIANIINQSRNPIIISDAEQIMDLLSMSHKLNSQVAIKIVNSTDKISSQKFDEFSEKDIFIFNPRNTVIQNIRKIDNITVKEVYKPHLRIPGEIHLSLWSVI